jgi:hypothetical protein
MNSRWPRKKCRATKWRQHCSTCGVTFKGPQIWGYCSKLCEVSRDGSEDPGDLPEDVIEEMIQLGLQKEIAPQRLKQGFQDQIDNMERLHARKTFRAENPITRDDPRFWAYIMDKQFEKSERARVRATQEFLRTVRRLVESEESGVAMGDSNEDLKKRMGIEPHEVTCINSSLAFVKHSDRLPLNPVILADLAFRFSDDDIEKLVERGNINPFMTGLLGRVIL